MGLSLLLRVDSLTSPARGSSIPRVYIIICVYSYFHLSIFSLSLSISPSTTANSPSISHTQSFKGKWSLMKTKLSDLKTTSTQSQAKLNNHIRDLEVLTRSGVLHEEVVPSSVSKESVRDGSRNLITRLQIGSGESRNSALDSLLRLIGEDDKNVLIAVAQGIIPVLVRLLDSESSPEIIEKTVTLIARVSTIDSSKLVLMAEGLLLLHYLIRVLDSGTGIAIEKACITLQTLTLSKEKATAIGSRGGISSLLEISQSGTPSSQAYAAAVLRNLAIFPDIRHNFMEEHVISVLLTLASSGTPLAQEYSISCLSNLVREDDDLKLLIARKGGIGSLKSFWDSAIVARSLEKLNPLSDIAMENDGASSFSFHKPRKRVGSHGGEVVGIGGLGIEKDPNRSHFQRTDQWMPVYSWLESLEMDEVIQSEEIIDWLTENPEVRDDLSARHADYHLKYYIKKCHLKVLKRKEKKKGLHTTIKTSSPRAHKTEEKKSLDSRDDALKQKEEAMKEVDILRGELLQVRKDRDKKCVQLQYLASISLITLKLEDLCVKSNVLEVGFVAVFN